MQTKENKTPNLDCPYGVPEAECCGNMSCKTLIARIKAKKEATQ
jgi:hypothetical protein